MIDTELYQLLSLALLLVVVLVLVALLGAIGRLAKTLGSSPERSDGAEAPSATEAEEAHPEPTPAERAAIAAEPHGEEAHPEPARAEPHAERAPGESREVSTGFVSTRAAEPEQTAAPRAGGTSETAVEAAPVQAAEDPTASEEPSEQPFEKDGRWWFRRGAELLVYDESTGQWTPAPTSAGPDERAAAASSTAAGTSQFGGAAADVEPAGESSGGFWKCPSCGAVNGSTASSCRMCFAARP